LFEEEGVGIVAGREIGVDEADALVNAGSLRCALWMMGSSPRWVEAREFRALWAERLRAHLADPSWAGMTSATELRTDEGERVLAVSWVYAPVCLPAPRVVEGI
jgi:hypothetical protein